MLKDKKVLITGTNRGIGNKMLERFASYHATVFSHARNKSEEFEKQCELLSKEYDTQIIPVYFDLLEEEQVKKSVMDIKKNYGIPDVLVSNAGVVGAVKLFTMTSMEDIQKTFEVNYFAQMRLIQYVARFMMRNKSGSIITVSSCAGLDGNTGMIDYVSSKSALIGATKRLAIELGEYGIRVNSLAPGLTDTDMGGRMSEELEKETLSKCIMKRKGKPEEIADVAAFLASDMSSFMTGQIIRVDGGLLE